MKSYQTPVVPSQLEALLTDDVLGVHQDWARLTVEEVRAMMPEPKFYDIGDRSTRAVVIDGDPQAGVNILAFPHQQSWKLSMAVRLLFAHAVNNPNGLTIGLPSNSVKDTYYSLNLEEQEQATKGNLQPFYEQQVRTLETIAEEKGAFGKTVVNGYSLGGLTALGIASIGSSKFKIHAVNAVEAPNKPVNVSNFVKTLLRQELH